MQPKNYSLSELTEHIQQVFKVNFEQWLWIRAEINELRENYNGHCYLELIEKDQRNDHVIARIKANIWASNYKMLKEYFADTTGETLRSGMKVLVAVTVEFHPNYGISLNIRDIDPKFTLGDMSARRLAILRQLEVEGIIHMNKEIAMPLIPQRIAVISSPTAAGYEDFCQHLLTNQQGFRFYPVLFSAIMQGEQAENSMIDALERVYHHVDLFDVVVIIRGGGATTDLACFDSYLLASHCAQFPKAIIAGIGHTRDQTILDQVAHRSVATPTAAADFLIQKLQDAYEAAHQPFLQILDKAVKIQQQQQHYLTQLNWKMKQALLQKSTQKKLHLQRLNSLITANLQLWTKHQWHRLSLYESKIQLHSPTHMLQFGYCFTTVNGKRLTSVDSVHPGDTLHTWVSDGSVTSTVNKTEKK